MSMGLFVMMKIHMALESIKMVLILMACLFSLDMTYRMGLWHAMGRMVRNVGSYLHFLALRTYYGIRGYPCDCCNCVDYCECDCDCECHEE